MNTIWKYTLQAEVSQEIVMPKGAVILSVGLQGKDVCLWALVDPKQPPRTRLIESYGTGEVVPRCERLRFIGTTIDTVEPYFHHFERVSGGE